MPTTERNLVVSHLEDLARHAGYELVEVGLKREIERCLHDLERARPDQVSKVQGKIEGLRFALGLPKQLFDQAKPKGDPRTIE